MVTSPFQIKSRVEGENTFVEIGGAIDEHAKFIEIKATPKVVVNLSSVSFINSIGTRAWALWLRQFPAPTDVILTGCPVLMVKGFGSVKGFLTDRCQVKSFYVPFYSDKTGERKDILAERGIHFTSNQTTFPEIKDSQGVPMEMDVVPELYFSFLKIK
jgi:hypothetical protein